MCSAGLAIRQVLPPSPLTAAYCACLAEASFQPALAPIRMRVPPPATFVPGLTEPERVNTVPFTVLAGFLGAALAPPTATTAVAASAATPPAAITALPRMVPPRGSCWAYARTPLVARQPSALAQIAGPLYKAVHGTCDLEWRDQLRAGQCPRQDVFRDVPQVGALPPAVGQDRHPDQAEARRPVHGRRGRVRGHRQGLRADARPVRAGRARGARRARPEGDEDDRHRGVRRIWPRSTRSTTTTPTTWRPRRAAPRPTGCCSTRCARPARSRSARS